MKRNASDEMLDQDRRKLFDYWFAPPLSYRFGAVINLEVGLVEVHANPASPAACCVDIPPT